MVNELFSDAKARLCDTQMQLTNRAIGAIRRNMGSKIFVLIPVVTLGLGGCVQAQAPAPLASAAAAGCNGPWP